MRLSVSYLQFGWFFRGRAAGRVDLRPSKLQFRGKRKVVLVGSGAKWGGPAPARLYGARRMRTARLPLGAKWSGFQAVFFHEQTRNGARRIDNLQTASDIYISIIL